MKRVVVLGSTGSVGINALKVIERFPDRFKVVGLTAYNNVRLLEKQIHEFKPTHAAVGEKGFRYLKNRMNGRKIKIGSAETDLEDFAVLREADIIVIAMGGSRALKPFLRAVQMGKTVATANKEALVIAGDILLKEAKKHGAVIIPIDSEQSAIFQCLLGGQRGELKKVYLTASGGRFLRIPENQFDRLSLREVLKHPRWKMGRKITVDSATLMNKGFEVIEAKRLFNLNVEDIEVVIHPEALIHSMVEFKDGSILAQMGITDMRLPIQYALTYPERVESGLNRLNFFQLKKLTFEKPNYRKFPCLALALKAAKKGGTLPSVLNAADEEVVEAFLNGKIRFSQIYSIVEKVVEKHKIVNNPGLDQILAADRWAREEARILLK